MSVLFSCGMFASELNLYRRKKKRKNATLIRVFLILYVAVIPLMDLFVSKIKINAWTLPFSLLMNSFAMLTICCSDRPGCEGQQKALIKIMEPPACWILRGLHRQTGC